ncbi:ROK family protein [Paenibacillus nanensis]|uniref:ROK family protein n=1 Tax=Paenibacillus nanensis TaxID=393251 RepID=A0A3A1VNL9_9BACL|nr:ROK family protein [Paenibacillus nanensis]RIX60123.1 ROK family protein [Paenibacillus nanensis]
MAQFTSAGFFLGIDIGGTGMKAGLVTPDGSIARELAVRTPVEEGGAGIMREMYKLADALLAEAGEPVHAIGVGSAGIIEPVSGRVTYATDNLPGWTGTPLAELLAGHTGLPVRADNDVNAAALGEAWVGAAKGCASFALAAVGTGIGGALVSGGRLVHGHLGRSGEIGHLILKQDGLPCNCGQRGCLEQYASGSALNRVARGIDPGWDSRELLRRTEAGDSRAAQAVDGFARDLAAGLISLYHVCGPEAIVIGGGLIETPEAWWHRLEQAVAEATPMPVRLEKAALGNKAGIIGAAYLAVSAAHSANP